MLRGARAVGFEPTRSFDLPALRAGAFDRSATHASPDADAPI